METFRELENFKKSDNSVVTIGSYDGLHLGHQKIIRNLVSKSLEYNVDSVVFTFDPHPRVVLNTDGSELKIIMDFNQKLKILESLGVKKTYIIPFTKEFSKMRAHYFMDEIVVPVSNPKELVIGYDHHFGYQREGGPRFLTDYCKNKDIKLEIIKSVKDGDEIISSTYIRSLIMNGFIKRANSELGFLFGFNAISVRGSGRGKDMNFPTANLVPKEFNQLIPKVGVYFCKGLVDDKYHFGMCNIGFRPTFDELDLVVEAHFFIENMGETYGKVIFIEFLERIRDEIKFLSQNDLVKQLKIDKEKCYQLMNKYS